MDGSSGSNERSGTGCVMMIGQWCPSVAGIAVGTGVGTWLGVEPWLGVIGGTYVGTLVGWLVGLRWWPLPRSPLLPWVSSPDFPLSEPPLGAADVVGATAGEDVSGEDGTTVGSSVLTVIGFVALVMTEVAESPPPLTGPGALVKPVARDVAVGAAPGDGVIVPALPARGT